MRFYAYRKFPIACFQSAGMEDMKSADNQRILRRYLPLSFHPLSKCPAHHSSVPLADLLAGCNQGELQH